MATSSQDSSQSMQILSIIITEFPAGGANYRVYKTTSSGADYLADPVALSIGPNTLSYQTVQTAITSSLDFSSYSITLPPIANSIGNIGFLITGRNRIVWLNDVKLTRLETP